MPKGPKGEKRPADVIGNAVKVTMEDVAALIEAASAKPNRPTAYKKRGAENSN